MTFQKFLKEELSINEGLLPPGLDRAKVTKAAKDALRRAGNYMSGGYAVINSVAIARDTIEISLTVEFSDFIPRGSRDSSGNKYKTTETVDVDVTIEINATGRDRRWELLARAKKDVREFSSKPFVGNGEKELENVLYRLFATGR